MRSHSLLIFRVGVGIVSCVNGEEESVPCTYLPPMYDEEDELAELAEGE